MRKFAGYLAPMLATAALAQPVQPVPKSSTPVREVLAASPVITISNGRITAKITPPDLKQGFYRGTRFDQAGVVTSLKLDGEEFYGPFYDRISDEVLDYTYAPNGIVSGTDSSVSGPVEEFGTLGFEPRPGLFVKPGVGVLRQPDARPYDHYRHYRIVDGGRRTTKVTPNSVTFTQALSGAGFGYVYEKTLRLVPASSQMVIEHRLKNTGRQAIVTTVYDHNFLRLVPNNDGIRIAFPFALAAAKPPAADLIRLNGKTLTYLRPMRYKERVSFLVSGYGDSASDYDITIRDSHGSKSVRMVGDAPITRVNIFSIDRVQSVEPYIAINLPPGAEKSWRYTYTYTP
jgi:hypothetical protein